MQCLSNDGNVFSSVGNTASAHIYTSDRDEMYE